MARTVRIFNQCARPTDDIAHTMNDICTQHVQSFIARHAGCNILATLLTLLITSPVHRVTPKADGASDRQSLHALFSHAVQITFRRIFQGVGIELQIPVHSPVLQGMEVVRNGRVRRSKLYYLRERIGKSAKLKEILQGAKSTKPTAREEKKAAAAAAAKE